MLLSINDYRTVAFLLNMIAQMGVRGDQDIFFGFRYFLSIGGP